MSTARRGGEDTLEPALQGFIKVCRVLTGLDEVHGWIFRGSRRVLSLGPRVKQGFL